MSNPSQSSFSDLEIDLGTLAISGWMGLTPRVYPLLLKILLITQDEIRDYKCLPPDPHGTGGDLPLQSALLLAGEYESLWDLQPYLTALSSRSLTLSKMLSTHPITDQGSPS